MQELYSTFITYKNYYPTKKVKNKMDFDQYYHTFFILLHLKKLI